MHFPRSLFPWYLTVKYLYVFHCFIICAILYHYHSSWFNCIKTVGASKETVTVLLWDSVVTRLWVGRLRNCLFCRRLALEPSQLLVWWVFGAPSVGINVWDVKLTRDNFTFHFFNVQGSAGKKELKKNFFFALFCNCHLTFVWQIFTPMLNKDTYI